MSSNVRRRNRKLARRIASGIQSADGAEAGFMAAMVAMGGVPRKPVKGSRKSGRWTMYPTHSMGTPEVGSTVVKMIRRMK